MFKTLLGLFTGSSKWLYIALAVLSLTCISLGSLSISLYGDKQALHVKVKSAQEALEKLEKEHKKKIEKLEKAKEELSEALAQTKADLQMQNALNVQYAVDMEKAKKTYEEAMAKKPPFRTQYVTIERTNDEAKDLQAFVKKWRTKP